jgi:hypothetical protein
MLIHHADYVSILQEALAVACRNSFEIHSFSEDFFVWKINLHNEDKISKI